MNQEILHVRQDEVSVGDFPVFTRSKSEAVQEIRSLRQSGGAHLVVTPNVSQVIALTRDVHLRAAYRSASLRLLDGMPLVFLARVLGAKNACRNTGADMLFAVAEAVSRSDELVAIVGGADGAACTAARELIGRYPTSRILGVETPYLDDVENAGFSSIVTRLARERPDYVFLCLGSPKQEHWYMHWRASLPPAVYIGAGAAVDFAARRVRRAPQMLQSVGAEWLWRLANEPRRLCRRYLIDGPKFIRLIVTSILVRSHNR